MLSSPTNTPHFVSPFIIPILLVGVSLLFVLTGCGQADLPAATPPSSPTEGISTPSPLPTRTYSPEVLTAIAIKQANLQAERDHDATRAAISPAPMHTGAPTYPPHPTEVLPIGIDTFEGCGGGEGNHDPLQVRNCWRGFFDGVYSGVVAGYAQATPEPGQEAQGGLYITSHLDDMDLFSRSPIYWTPVRAGAVQIIAVDGTRFILQTYNGTHFVFDVSTRQWVDATPGPSPVPSLPPSPVPSLPPTP